MFRVDDPSAVPALPTPGAAGTPGYFTEGVPGVTPATLVRADFLNMVQDELMAIVVAGGLTPSKTTRNQVLLALQAGAAGLVKTVKRQVIASSGAYTPSAGMAYCDVEIIGAGAGGGGGNSTSATGGSGGGAGSYAKGRFTAAQIGASQSVTVGAAGSGGAANANGTSGGNSSFGALLIGNGGSFGVTGSSSATQSVQPGLGGTASGGDFSCGGGDGFCGYVASSFLGGHGGLSFFGGGGAGAYYGGAARAGTAYGSGGGAGYAGISGGAGGAGLCIITEYCTQ